MKLKIKTNQIYDDYLITEHELGTGLSGKILKIIDKTTGKHYALKALIENDIAKREVNLHWIAAQSCSHIVQIKDVYSNTISSRKLILIVMELMEGGELFTLIDELNKKNEHFTEKEVALIMKQICLAVKHLHSINIAHRDLKPENILLSNKIINNSLVIKLTDFGFAKEEDSGLITPCCTPYYVAPEILSVNSFEYSMSCDIWSLGVIMYILLCGYPPFYSHTGAISSPGMNSRIQKGKYTFPDKDWSKISDDAKTLIRGMLDTNPDKRISVDTILNSKWIAVKLSLIFYYF
jgi:mitogen-activated protein kinase-activated protein kinase 2